MFQTGEHLNAIVHISLLMVERRKRGRPVESIRNIHVIRERSAINKKEDDRKLEIIIAKNDRLVQGMVAANNAIMQIVSTNITSQYLNVGERLRGLLRDQQGRLAEFNEPEQYLNVSERLRGLLRDQPGRLAEFNEPEAPPMFNIATSNLSASNLSASNLPTQVAAPVSVYDVSGDCFW